VSFSKDIANYAKRTKVSIDKAVVQINLQLTTDIIKKTPVDEGRLISNWMPSFDTPSGIATLSIVTEQEKIKEVEADALKSAGKVFYLTNNLTYAHAIEYGHSKVKSPKGMLRVSIQDARAILRAFRTTK